MTGLSPGTIWTHPAGSPAAGNWTNPANGDANPTWTGAAILAPTAGGEVGALTGAAIPGIDLTKPVELTYTFTIRPSGGATPNVDFVLGDIAGNFIGIGILADTPSGGNCSLQLFVQDEATNIGGAPFTTTMNTPHTLTATWTGTAVVFTFDGVIQGSGALRDPSTLAIKKAYFLNASCTVATDSLVNAITIRQ